MRLLTAFVLTLLLAPTASQAQNRSSDRLQGDNEYKIGPQDVLEIQVWGQPELSSTTAVGLSGLLRLPLLGEVRIDNLSPAELGDYLTDRYQLLDPSVAEVLVSISEYHSRSINVVGEVRSPDEFGFRELPDLWAAILKAGGPTGRADLALVQVVRADPNTGADRVITVDLSRGVNGTDPALIPQLQAKDTILIPSSDGVSAGGDRFHVLGAVRAPGPYHLTKARTIVEAISVSGGYRPDAKISSVRLTRQTSTGVVNYKLDLKAYLYDGESMASLTLQAGDTITVPKKSSIWSGVRNGLGLVLPIASLVVTVIIAGNN